MRRVYVVLLAAVAIVLVFNPVYTLFTILSQGVAPAGFVNLVKFTPYLLLIGGLAGAVFWRVRQSGLSAFRSAPLEIKLAAAVLGWSIITVTFSSAGPWQSLRGLNVDFAGLLLFITVWLLAPNLENGRRLRYVILGVLGFLAVLSIPEYFWNHAFRVWSGHSLVYHYVGDIPQLRSLASGPNPFGTLIELAAILVAMTLKNGRSIAIWMVPAGLLLGMTYARSAWIGAAVAGGGYFFYVLAKQRKIVWWPLVLGGSILLGGAIGMVTYNETITGIFTHGQSTDQHAQSAHDALKKEYSQSAPQILFGHGLGTAGPVVLDNAEAKKNDLPKIVESWYIQLVQELGIVGLSLYLWLYVVVTRELFRKQVLAGFLALGLAANALTLHIWSADANINLLFWTAAALVLYVGAKPAKQ
jgi:hypothetical protein